MSVKICSFISFVCLPIWKLKELIYMFGSSYKKVNTNPAEVSLYKKMGQSKMKFTFLNAGSRCILQVIEINNVNRNYILLHCY